MRVFTLRSDPNRFESVVPIDPDEWAQLQNRFRGSPIGPSWYPIEVMVDREPSEDDDLSPDAFPSGELLPSDFPSSGGIIPVFSERAVQALGELLQAHGEILPLTCAEGTYFAYNVTHLIDALDLQRSNYHQFSSGVIFDITRHEFLPERVGDAAIFKLTQMPGPGEFVTDEFVQRVDEAGLQGFNLQQVWSAPN